MKLEDAMRTKRSLWLLAALLLVAAILRFYALGRDGLWCDEAYTAFTVRMPLGEMITTLMRMDDAPPFFYIVAKSVTSIAGDSEAALRTGSALAGLLAVGLLAWLAYRRRSAAYGWSAALMAIATYGVFHARQARSYMLVILLSLCVVLSARALLRGRRRAGPLLAISALLLCMTHHAAIVLPMTSLLLWPLGSESRLRLRAWLLWHAIPLIGWTVYWIMAGPQFDVHLTLNDWTAYYWQTHSFGLAPLYSLGVFLPAGLPARMFGTGFALAEQLGLIWTVLSIALALICAWGVILRKERAAIIEFAFLIGPLVALMIISRITTPIYVLTRTDAVAYPAFILLMGRGLARLPRYLAGGMLSYWLVVSLVALAPTYGIGAPEKGNDRRVAQDMAAGGLKRDDWVVHTFMTAPSIEYYLERRGAEHRIAYFPRLAGRNNASGALTPVDSLQAYVQEARELRAAMEASLPADGAAWIFAQIEPQAAEALRRKEGAGTLSVPDIGYPVSALVFMLIGTEAVCPVTLYAQDWVAGHRALLRIPRRAWVPVDSLPPI